MPTEYESLELFARRYEVLEAEGAEDPIEALAEALFVGRPTVVNFVVRRACEVGLLPGVQARYQHVAARYEALESEGSEHPSEAIADELHISGNTAAAWVEDAWRFGLLPEAPRSRRRRLRRRARGS
jgi:hypothetical protein